MILISTHAEIIAELNKIGKTDFRGAIHIIEQLIDLIDHRDLLAAIRLEYCQMYRDHDFDQFLNAYESYGKSYIRSRQNWKKYQGYINKIREELK